MQSILARGTRVAEIVGGGLIAAILIAVVAGVVQRYVFGAPITWVDEVISALFVWAVFWTAGMAVPLRDHVAFEIIDEALPLRTRRVLAIVAALAAGGALAAAAPKLIDFIAFLWRERTPALQWRLDLVYACFALFIVAMAVRFMARAIRLFGRNWRDEL